ncbi:MAG: iron-only hydrogenase system regulator [Lentisphaeria bacterium]|jgi:putative iron-only hydrogenase system regulator|nr:iron-only hydrogenase system regulator [Lentisphaeria bacterium]
MENRVAVLAILAESRESAEKINGILHEFNNWIIGRMGLPYREKKINIISIVLDAPADKINALAGKLGRLEGVTARAVCAGMNEK